MARTVLNAPALAPEGASPMTPVPSDTANGNEISNATGLVLEVTNPGGASATITFITQANVGGYAVVDVPVTVPAGETRVFGHFPPGVFGTSLQFDTTAALDVKAYR